ncbi:MAG: hypothetical protein JJE55_14440 [Flavobacteriaceae bacterium]|nr:hypothetical protein [Flavobacteriaceae bacterium]
MKGAVLIIGSLLWENEKNALNSIQGKLRSDWRKKLDLEKKIAVNVPIRYGRKSTSRSCTYTMIFSNSVSDFGTAFIVPFKNEIEGFEELKHQALELSEAEGISTEKHPNRLKASWGSVGVLFNKSKEKELDSIKRKWHQEFNFFKNSDYKIGKEEPSIKNNGELNFPFKIPENIDYVFATPVVPNISEYPTNEKIIEAIIESKPRYDTYIKENFQNGIRVQGDEEIIRKIG